MFFKSTSTVAFEQSPSCGSFLVHSCQFRRFFAFTSTYFEEHVMISAGPRQSTRCSQCGISERAHRELYEAPLGILTFTFQPEKANPFTGRSSYAAPARMRCDPDASCMRPGCSTRVWRRRFGPNSLTGQSSGVESRTA